MYRAPRAHRSASSRRPCGPSQDRWIAAAIAINVWLVQTFDDASARRMCCSRVDRVRTNAAGMRVTIGASRRLARREQADVRAAEAKRGSERLPLPHRHVGAETADRPQQPRSDGVGLRDEQGTGVVRAPCRVGDVRFGSQADVTYPNRDVRYSPNSTH